MVPCHSPLFLSLSLFLLRTHIKSSPLLLLLLISRSFQVTPLPLPGNYFPAIAIAMTKDDLREFYQDLYTFSFVRHPFERFQE